MRTAALLPTPGNPFLVLYWLRNFDRVWRGEVDELRVHVNQQPDGYIRDWIRAQVEVRGGIYSERLTPSSHGIALRDLIESTDAEAVMLCEDDAFVRRIGAVRGRFNQLDLGLCDVSASPRGSMTPGLARRAKERWGPAFAIEERVEGGHGFWPAFVFARRDVLLATDRNFDARVWEPNTYVESLDWSTEMEECADTFGNTALQLWNTARIQLDVQYKGPYAWASWLDRGHDIPWFHCGSLSSSGNLAVEHEPEELDPVAIEDKPQWAHRLYWWKHVVDVTRYDVLPSRRDLYLYNWTRLRKAIGVELEEVQAWEPIVSRMVTWE